MTDGLPSPPSWPVARGPERWLVPGRTGNFDLACGVPSRPPPRLSKHRSPERDPPTRASPRPILSVRGRKDQAFNWLEPSPERSAVSITSRAPLLRNLEGGPPFRQRLFWRDEAGASQLIRRAATRNG